MTATSRRAEADTRPDQLADASHDMPAGTDSHPTPSWFPQSAFREPPADLIDRYRQSRFEPVRAAPPSGREFAQFRQRQFEPDRDARDGDSQRWPPPRRHPPRARNERDIEDFEHHFAPEPPRRRPSRHHLADTRAFWLAGLMAVVAGVALGAAATQMTDVGDKLQKIATIFEPRRDAAASHGASQAADRSTTTISRKPIATATLTVDDVAGRLNSMIPLELHAEPAFAGQNLSLRISGLPEAAYLTAGTKVSGDAWLLDPLQAESVKLVVPKAATSRFDMSVAAFEAGSGELAAPVKQLSVAISDASVDIQPASAVPETATIKAAADPDKPAASAIPAPLQKVATNEEAADLMRKGDLLMKSGDLSMARQFYERAFAQGLAAAAMGAGRTYDPTVHARLNVQGMAPDPLRAMEWYMRASAAGIPEATQAIETLKQAATTPAP